MQKIILVSALVVAFFATTKAQELTVKNDTIYLIEDGRRMVLDSISIDNRINYIKNEVSQYDNLILKTKAAKSDKQTTLTYFLEIRNKFWQIKRNTQKGKGK